MSKFSEHILIKLAPSEPDFVALTTFNTNHGKSQPLPSAAD